jgi:PAS domain-containing protein
VLPVEGKERVMGADDLIVSKTDLKGHITYANDTFLRMAELTLAETIGKPHSIIRSRAMPRSVFQLLWEKNQGGEEICA